MNTQGSGTCFMAHSYGLGPPVGLIQGSSEVCDLENIRMLAQASFWHHLTRGVESLKRWRWWGEDSEAAQLEYAEDAVVHKTSGWKHHREIA